MSLIIDSSILQNIEVRLIGRQLLRSDKCALRINYWSTHKPVRSILSFVLSVTQQYKHKKYLCNSSIHYGKYGEYTYETRAPYLDT